MVDPVRLSACPVKQVSARLQAALPGARPPAAGWACRSRSSRCGRRSPGNGRPGKRLDQIQTAELDDAPALLASRDRSRPSRPLAAQPKYRSEAGGRQAFEAFRGIDCPFARLPARASKCRSLGSWTFRTRLAELSSMHMAIEYGLFAGGAGGAPDLDRVRGRAIRQITSSRRKSKCAGSRRNDVWLVARASIMAASASPVRVLARRAVIVLEATGTRLRAPVLPSRAETSSSLPALGPGRRCGRRAGGFVSNSAASGGTTSDGLVKRGPLRIPYRAGPGRRIRPTRPSPRIAPPATPGTFLNISPRRLDHHLLFADQFVHQHAERLPFDLGHDQHACAGSSVRGVNAKTRYSRTTGSRHSAHQRHLGAFLHRPDQSRRRGGTSRAPRTAGTM